MQINPCISFDVSGFSYMLTQLLIYVSKEEGSRGEYTKKWGPGPGKFIDGGLSGALNRVGGLDWGSGRG